MDNIKYLFEDIISTIKILDNKVEKYKKENDLITEQLVSTLKETANALARVDDNFKEYKKEVDLKIKRLEK